MANENINQHISSTERSKWNQNIVDLKNHIEEENIHIPPPPNDGGNYYLGSNGNTIAWKKVPVSSIT